MLVLYTAFAKLTLHKYTIKIRINQTINFNDDLINPFLSPIKLEIIHKTKIPTKIKLHINEILPEEIEISIVPIAKNPPHNILRKYIIFYLLFFLHKKKHFLFKDFIILIIIKKKGKRYL